MMPNNLFTATQTPCKIAWSSPSLFDQPSANDDNMIGSIGTASKVTTTSVIGNSNATLYHISAPKPPQPPPSRVTPRRQNKSRNQQRQQPGRHHDHKQSRSKSIRGATNLTRETKLLRNRLDRLVETFQHTVVASAKSQATQLESLRAENEQLRAQIGELETETLKQFSELEDCEDLMAKLEENRLSSQKEASMWKTECESLTKEAVFLKAAIEKYRRNTGEPKWMVQTEQLGSENASLKRELSAKVKTIQDLEQQLRDAKEKVVVDKENTNGLDGRSGIVRFDENPSLMNARRIFGQQIPASFLNSEDSNSSGIDNNSTRPGAVKSNHRRKSFHGMTLRGRNSHKNYKF